MSRWDWHIEEDTDTDDPWADPAFLAFVVPLLLIKVGAIAAIIWFIITAP